jgi:hypothetical protein
VPPLALVPEVVTCAAHEPPPAVGGAGLRCRRAGASGTSQASRSRGRRVCRAAAAASARPSFCKTTVGLSLSHKPLFHTVIVV